MLLRPQPGLTFWASSEPWNGYNGGRFSMFIRELLASSGATSVPTCHPSALWCFGFMFCILFTKKGRDQPKENLPQLSWMLQSNKLLLGGLVLQWSIFKWKFFLTFVLYCCCSAFPEIVHKTVFMSKHFLQIQIYSCILVLFPFTAYLRDYLFILLPAPVRPLR